MTIQMQINQNGLILFHVSLNFNDTMYIVPDEIWENPEFH